MLLGPQNANFGNIDCSDMVCDRQCDLCPRGSIRVALDEASRLIQEGFETED